MRATEDSLCGPPPRHHNVVFVWTASRASTVPVVSIEPTLSPVGALPEPQESTSHSWVVKVQLHSSWLLKKDTEKSSNC